MLIQEVRDGDSRIIGDDSKEGNATVNNTKTTPSTWGAEAASTMGGNKNITDDSNIGGGLDITKGEGTTAIAVGDGEEGGQKNRLQEMLHQGCWGHSQV